MNEEWGDSQSIHQDLKNLGLLLLCWHLVYPIVSIAISNDLAANRIFSHDIICIAVFITHLLCKLVT
jgi:hypothetical protein